LFLILQYRLIRDYGGIPRAMLTLVFTVIFSSTIVLWSTKARGGFTGTLFWGTLAYYIFFRLMDGYLSRGKGDFGKVILLGLIMGIGFWNCSMVAYYYFPIVLYLAVFGIAEFRTGRVEIIRDWRPSHGRRSATRRWIYKIIFAVIGAYLLFGLVTVILGEIDFSILGLRVRSHHGIRDIWRGVSLLVAALAFIGWNELGIKSFTDLIRRFLPRCPHLVTAAVVIITYLLITGGINLYFQGLPDYTYGHYLHVGTADGLEGIGKNIPLLFTRLLPKITGVSPTSIKLDLGRTPLIRYCSIANGLTAIAGTVFVLLLLTIRGASRVPSGAFIKTNRVDIFFLVSFLGCLGALAFSSQIKDSTAYRYLIPIVSWVPFFLASLSFFLWKKWRPAGVFLGAVVIAGHFIKLLFFIPQPELAACVPEIINALKEENITRAYADYWLAYPITFLTGEEIIAAPYRSMDRYPPYTREVKKSPEVACIFKGHELFPGRRLEDMLIIKKIPYDKKNYPWGYILVVQP
ncbi:MAG: hypothetical protein RAO92_04025, partial [Candidatus Euphemobacter frigidus]|nr:hypothetical protein [Candidatus Euphemobacter frigidus]